MAISHRRQPPSIDADLMVLRPLQLGPRRAALSRPALCDRGSRAHGSRKSPARAPRFWGAWAPVTKCRSTKCRSVRARSTEPRLLRRRRRSLPPPIVPPVQHVCPIFRAGRVLTVRPSGASAGPGTAGIAPTARNQYRRGRELRGMKSERFSRNEHRTKKSHGVVGP